MKLAIGITGASGAIYAQQFLNAIKDHPQISDIGVVMSDNAKTVWKWELGSDNYKEYKYTFWSKDDFMAPIASGSAGWDALVILPCSMGMIGRIAHGISDDLITRAADVMLKERKKLICVPRETPYNAIHLQNMLRITEARGIILPASPSFYSKPESLEALALTVVARVLDLLNLTTETYRWGKNK